MNKDKFNKLGNYCDDKEDFYDDLIKTGSDINISEINELFNEI